MFASSKSGAVADQKDANFKNVTMLLHGNGTNGAQNNTFLDSSTNNFTITRNGNTTQGTFSPYGSNWSNYFDGSGDYLTTPSNSAFTLGSSGDFTIECWVYLTSTPGDYVPFATTWVNASSTYANRWFLGVGTSGRLTWFDSAGNFGVNESTSITLNTWLHIAVVRNGSTITMYKNGVSVGTQTTNQSYTTNNLVSIGYIASGNYLPGYISNLRIVKGTAVYTSAFTPPTTPLTAITNTSLLTCADNRFIDDSTNNFTITVNGNTSVQRFSPFSPTTAYSTSVIGGSGYFDGTTDFLTASSNSAFGFGTGDFTMECWVYPISWVGLYDGFISTLNSVSALGAHLSRDGVEVNGVATAWGTTLQLNTWTHLALTRSGTSLRLFVNGAITNTATNSANVGTSLAFAAGRRLEDVSNYYCNAYISNARIIKGTAVYTAAFTPNTAPLSAISGTSILLSATNAGILDNAMMNDLETVGNAQISTSVKKYGTGSMYFDGTGDYLYGPTSPNTSFGTGDFTIEFWMYSNNVSGASQLGMLQMSDSAGGLKASYLTQLCINQGQTASGSALNGAIVANINNTNVGSTTAVLTTGTWYHIALVRSSGTVNLYVNGTSVGSATITSAINGPYIVVGGYYSSSFLFNGYLDDVRITKGFARYTSSFTPPTAAFADKG